MLFPGHFRCWLHHLAERSELVSQSKLLSQALNDSYANVIFAGHSIVINIVMAEALQFFFCIWLILVMALGVTCSGILIFKPSEH